jgi:hypothetical protein
MQNKLAPQEHNLAWTRGSKPAICDNFGVSTLWLSYRHARNFLQLKFSFSFFTSLVYGHVSYILTRNSSIVHYMTLEKFIRNHHKWKLY